MCAFGHPVATCCEMFGIVGSSLKMVKVSRGLRLYDLVLAVVFREVVVLVLIVVRCTRPRSIPLAILALKKELHGFLKGFYFYACIWFSSYSYGAPLGGPSGPWAPLTNEIGMSARRLLVAGMRAAKFFRSKLWSFAIFCFKMIPPTKLEHLNLNWRNTSFNSFYSFDWQAVGCILPDDIHWSCSREGSNKESTE